MSQHRAALRRAELKALAITMVLEAVHIGNLGPLPPSPAMLVWKAYQIGLLTEREYETVDSRFVL